MKEVQLPSGAILKIQLAPFADARNLYQAILAELKAVGIEAEVEIANTLKDIFFISFSSKLIDSLVWVCFKKCLYNDFKIDNDTFEPEEARDDYIKALSEVARENVMPFFKSLFAEYKIASSIVRSTPKPSSAMKP